MESKAAEILNEYQENIESMDEVVDTMDDIINEILDKHGEKIGAIMGKMAVKTLLPIFSALQEAKVSEITANCVANYCGSLRGHLKDLGFNDEACLAIICASLKSVR